MTADEYKDWVAAAREKTQNRIAEARKVFGLGAHQRYAIDLPTATIRFFDANDIERASADIQVAGSWSPDSSTWLWGWENESLPDAVVFRLRAVRELGASKKVRALQASVVQCDEGEAWSMASLAADILNARCVYRAHGARSELFLLLFLVKVVI